MRQRCTFIGHNSQHIIKSLYFRELLKKKQSIDDFTFIWNAWEPLNRRMISRFENIIEIPPWNTVNRLKYMYRYQGRGFRLEKEFAKYKDILCEDWIYIFSDEVLNTIRFLDLLSNVKNKKYHVILLDEGSALYYEYYTRYHLTKRLIKRIVFGIPEKKCTFIGWHPRIEKIIAQTPDDVVAKLKKNRVIEQEPSIWSDKDYWAEWLKECGISLNSDLKGLTLYIGTTDVDADFRSRERNMLKDLVCVLGNGKIAIKPHPRCKEGYYDCVRNDCVILDNPMLYRIPVELLVNMIQPRKILAISSASIENIVTNNSDVEVYVLYRCFNMWNIDELYIRLTEKYNNVKIMNTVDELIQQLMTGIRKEVTN